MSSPTPAFVALERLLDASLDGSRVVAEADGESIDIARFRRDVAAWRAAFAAAAVTRCALHFDDSHRFACALFGAWTQGVQVWLPADALPATLARLVGRVDAVAGDISGSTLPTIDAMKAADARPVDVILQRDADLLVVFTSGTTGEPVAISKRLGQLFDEVATLARLWDVDIGAARVLATVSHQHIYGLLFRVLWPLASGRPFAAKRLAFPEDIARELARAPALLVASPAHLKRLPDALPWRDGRDNLRGLFSSGGPLPATALADCRRLLGRAPVEIYGSSETGGIGWRRRDRDDDVAWRWLPDVRASVDDGRLRIHSPFAGDEAGVVTADRVVLDGDRFELLARDDRIVKVEEKRISLAAIETALAASGLVDAARGLLLPGERTQLGVVAVPTPAGWDIIDRHGRRALAERLRGVLADVVEAAARPRRWRFVDTLPSNRQGKTTDALLVDQFDPRRPLLRTLARSDVDASVTVTFPRTSPYFDGHFDDLPILPGIVQVDWAIRLGRELFAMTGDVVRIDALKFREIALPEQVLQLRLGHDAAASTLSFDYQSSRGEHGRGRVVFAGAAR